MKKKLLITLSVVACALLLVVGSIAGTIAYMTSKTGIVTNTFTSGKVTITLDEAKVTAYGVKDGDSRVTENKYKLIPGHEYVKDPTIHVDDDSEDCYLFVKVENGLADALAATTIAAQMTANGWAKVAGEENVYYYTKAAADGQEATSVVSGGTDVVVFESFTLLGTADVSALTSKTITVQAYAVQADGFDDAADAWAKAPCTWGVESL